jgi:hypothetical protein
VSYSFFRFFIRYRKWYLNPRCPEAPRHIGEWVQWMIRRGTSRVVWVKVNGRRRRVWVRVNGRR